MKERSQIIFNILLLIFKNWLSFARVRLLCSLVKHLWGSAWFSVLFISKWLSISPSISIYKHNICQASAHKEVPSGNYMNEPSLSVWEHLWFSSSHSHSSWYFPIKLPHELFMNNAYRANGKVEKSFKDCKALCLCSIKGQFHLPAYAMCISMKNRLNSEKF